MSPTPSGLLRRGDQLRWSNGAEAVVVRRTRRRPQCVDVSLTRLAPGDRRHSVGQVLTIRSAEWWIAHDYLELVNP